MGTPQPALAIERTFNAPVSKVWNALTNNGEMKKWYFDLKEFKPQKGFEFHFSCENNGINFIHQCKITEVIPDKKLAYTWRYDGYEGNSLVTFELFDEGNKTRLKLIHEGLETFPKVPDFTKENFMAGWTQIIGENLRKLLE